MEAVWEHLGVKVELTSGFRFLVHFPEGAQAFDSRKEAESAIEAILSIAKFELKVLARNGEQYTITGISRTDGSFNGLPPDQRHTEVYVVADWIKTLLVELEAIEVRKRYIENLLRPVRLQRPGGGRASPREFAKATEGFKEEYAARTKVANEVKA